MRIPTKSEARWFAQNLRKGTALNVRVVEKADGYSLYYMRRTHRVRPRAASGGAELLFNKRIPSTARTYNKKSARTKFVESFNEEQGIATVGATGDPLVQIDPNRFKGARSIEWGTPTDLFNALNCELGPFDIDASAAGEWIAKCPRFITPEEDALADETDWGERGERVWLNAPYGKAMGPFMEKAAQQASEGRMICSLNPVRTDTRWWADNVMSKATEVRLIQGRLAYENWEGGQLLGGSDRKAATFPSCVIIFTPDEIRPQTTLPDETTTFTSNVLGVADNIKSLDEQMEDSKQGLLIDDPPYGPYFGLIDRKNEWLTKPLTPDEIRLKRRYLKRENAIERQRRLKSSSNRRDRWIARRSDTHPVTGDRIPKGEDLKLAIAEYIYDNGPATSDEMYYALLEIPKYRRMIKGKSQITSFLNFDPRFAEVDGGTFTFREEGRRTARRAVWGLTLPEGETP